MALAYKESEACKMRQDREIFAAREAHLARRRDQDSKTPEWVTAVAAVLTAIAAFLALWGARATLKDNRQTARQRVTHESVARLEAPDLIESKAMMSSFLRGGLQPPNISDEDWASMDETARLAVAPKMGRHLNRSSSLEDRRRMQQILAYPNMLERLAGMYNHGLLDRGIVKTRVEIEAKNFWDRASWWIAEIKSPEGDEKCRLRS